MNQNNQYATSFECEVMVEPAVSEVDTLVQCGFAPEEIVSLVWLRDWYQSGGSDRAEVVRHLEFLKLLVTSGQMEL